MIFHTVMIIPGIKRFLSVYVHWLSISTVPARRWERTPRETQPKHFRGKEIRGAVILKVSVEHTLSQKQKSINLVSWPRQATFLIAQRAGTSTVHTRLLLLVRVIRRTHVFRRFEAPMILSYMICETCQIPGTYQVPVWYNWPKVKVARSNNLDKSDHCTYRWYRSSPRIVCTICTRFHGADLQDLNDLHNTSEDHC